jgi:ubiquinol-cytochrome c reductase iron-sulfur subunit
VTDLERSASAGDGHSSLDVLHPESQYPVADPGHPEHLPRLTDVDVPVLAIGFAVAYFAVPRTMFIDFAFLHVNLQHFLLGSTAGLALLLIGVGAVQWARQLMDDHEMVDYRHSATSDQDDREYVVTELQKGTEESKITRRKVLGRSLIGALAAMGIPLVVSFADLGPWPTKKRRAATIETTIWHEGVRLVNDITYVPIKASDLEIGQLVNGQPENIKELEGTELQQAKAKSSIIVVRMDPRTIQIPASRQDWQVGGILCYSKICTHVGCPISLWEQQTHHLLCPCHQSTFDLGNSGLVIFGPAARALPQLPITVDAEGYLVARSGFTVPVGPSYFERDSRNDFKEGDN